VLLALPIRLGSRDRFVCGTQLLLPGVHARVGAKKSHTRIKYRSPKGASCSPIRRYSGFNPPTKKSSDRDVLDAIVAEDDQGPATSRDGPSEVLEWLELDASPSPSRDRSICTSVSDAVHS
jgi:hypothetical protein